MNNTPCPECNRLHAQVVENWINRDWQASRKTHEATAAHEAVCPIINGAWYKQLWKNAVIGRDVYRDVRYEVAV